MNKEHDEQFEVAYGMSDSIIGEIEKVVLGKHNAVSMLVTAMFAGGHVLIEDVPGVGKTTLAASLAKAAGLNFKRAQFTPDVMASDITGFNIYNRQTESFDFKEGLVMCNILLADEINRASPKTQSSLLEAMEESRVTVDGVTYEVPNPFMVIATQNPTGFVGTYPLPEAQLDRFSARITMGYPSVEEEVEIISARKTINPADKIVSVSSLDYIIAIRKLTQLVNVSDELYKYIVLLTSVTRKNENLALGASPRASLALMRMSQAYAFTHHRNYVVPEDICAVYKYVIAHRIILKQEAKLNRVTADNVLSEIMHKTEIPFKSKR